MSDDLLGRNDKVNKAAQELGYCCAFCFFCKNNGKRDVHKRVAKTLNVALSTIEFNRRKIRNGEMQCPNLSTCQLTEEEKKGKQE